MINAEKYVRRQNADDKRCNSTSTLHQRFKACTHNDPAYHDFCDRNHENLRMGVQYSDKSPLSLGGTTGTLKSACTPWYTVRE